MSLLNPYQRARILLTAAAVASYGVFWIAGAMLQIPNHPGEEGSLLQQPNPITAVLIVAFLLVASIVLGTALAGMVRFNAGLVAGAIGLAALSFRAGTIRETIFWGLAHGSSGRLFGTLLAEMAILGTMVTVCGWMLNILHTRGVLKDRESSLPVPDSSLANEASSLAIQAIVTAGCILLLARSEAKLQAMAAVGLGSFAGAAVGETLFPSARRTWAFLPPLIVGMAGYALAMADPAGARIGSLGGTFAPLSMPLPLDYASAGPAGALLGHWSGRRWARQRAQEASAARA